MTTQYKGISRVLHHAFYYKSQKERPDPTLPHRAIITKYYEASDLTPIHSTIEKRLLAILDTYKKEMPEVQIFMDNFEKNCLVNLDELSE
ncbi:hypothetical protein NDQ71_16230 [Pseudoalteromonas sp. KG3]|uniref:hypothetical protein n=1 Tax=Pseudoalteromonas sp. KG3 TaxID=2951137 RepID=UPI00265ACDEB|nr:hypothetical protein [Pseudoalteromonas sp. KG3]WKD23150.1 hypothetical protein NDQ71_16210 [Pseudoalteromonas sp. KG3]WKD23154.1 hypothetical protein NDQ71_16230 [Pseudoalteromonas sp. KG3]